MGARARGRAVSTQGHARHGGCAVRRCPQPTAHHRASAGALPAGPFLEPVQWKEWGLLDYPKVVKNPMDLGTVKRKLDAGQYTHPKEFKHDVSLVWINCMTYNAVRGQRGRSHGECALRPRARVPTRVPPPRPDDGAAACRTAASTGTWRRV